MTGCCSRASSGASRTSPTRSRRRTTCRSATSTKARSTRHPSGTVDVARWFGAGFPDYPWLFATDGEYTSYAAVAAGQFDTVKAHLRALRTVSDILNNRSGKVAHEVIPTGDVYFGSNTSAGNTDETVKFPSIVALLWRWTGDDRFRDEMYDFSVRNLKYVYTDLDADHDGWPEGLANVERSGMGSEKLDSTVYLARGLRDLADLAASKHDKATQQWATAKADDIQKRFETQWWVAKAFGYADSIDDPANPANDNTPIFQRHWTGVTPMEAEVGDAPPGLTRTCEDRPRSTREALLHRRIWAVPHRHRTDGRPRRQPWRLLRRHGFGGQERAEHLLAEHLHHGRC